MTAPGAGRPAEPRRADGYRFLIVEARFYEEISDELLRGATTAIEAAGALFEVVTVPGALEIPAAIAMALDAGFDGFVALGCVIRGETTHYELVSGESARGLMDLSTRHVVAVGNGILTVENESQAWSRARVAEQDKGGGAARAAIAMAILKARLASR